MIADEEDINARPYPVGQSWEIQSTKQQISDIYKRFKKVTSKRKRILKKWWHNLCQIMLGVPDELFVGSTVDVPYRKLITDEERRWLDEHAPREPWYPTWFGVPYAN